MVSLHSGTKVKTEPGSTKKSKTVTWSRKKVMTGKKRKSTEAQLNEREGDSGDDHETLEPSKSPTKQEETTPPPSSPTPKNHERIPGRNGPIKKEDFRCEPDIKPFKGPKGHKVRKTACEKEEYKQFVLENEGHIFHELHVCYAKGPSGSPTYDKSGLQLDYHKVADWMAPTPCTKNAMIKGMDRAVAKAQDEEAQMKEIFYEKGEAPPDEHLTTAKDRWKDRVSKDLDIPWHKVGVPDFKKWEKMGFKKAKKGEYLDEISDEERARLTRLLSGASLRK